MLVQCGAPLSFHPLRLGLHRGTYAIAPALLGERGVGVGEDVGEHTIWTVERVAQAESCAERLTAHEPALAAKRGENGLELADVVLRSVARRILRRRRTAMPEEFDNDRTAELGQSSDVGQPLCATRQEAVDEEDVRPSRALDLVVEAGLISLPARCSLHCGGSVARGTGVACRVP